MTIRLNLRPVLVPLQIPSRAARKIWCVKTGQMSTGRRRSTQGESWFLLHHRNGGRILVSNIKPKQARMRTIPNYLQIRKMVRCLCLLWFFFLYFLPKATHNNLRIKIPLEFPKVRPTNYGIKSLNFKGPKIWNSLPDEIKTDQNTKQFKNSIKTWFLSNKCAGSFCNKWFVSTQAIFEVALCWFELAYITIVNTNIK